MGNWTGYGGIGGAVNDNAGCTTQAAGHLVCGVSAIDDVFYADVYNGSGWLGFAKIGGTGVGIALLRAARPGPGRVRGTGHRQQVDERGRP